MPLVSKARVDKQRLSAPPSDIELIDIARAVLRDEAAAIAALQERIGPALIAAVNLIAEAHGRVIITGVGKSGLIGQKIAATMISTGTPAVFVHPVDALHGDLGCAGPGDVAVVISHSGGATEIDNLLEYLAQIGIPVIAMTGRATSNLARRARVVLDCAIDREAGPLGLAPTTSTTVTLALGDALAIALSAKSGFDRDDFQRVHPGGILGRKLTLRVSDLAVTEDVPWLGEDATMHDSVTLIANRRGTVPILSQDRRVIGVVTAGDLTRLLQTNPAGLGTSVVAVMNPSPKMIGPDRLAADAIRSMEENGIMAMLVVDGKRRLLGIVHLHDILRAGV